MSERPVMPTARRTPAPDFDADPSGWLPALLEVLDEQVATCRDIEAMARAQTDAVANGETGAMLRVLSERQVLVDRVEAGDRRLDTFRPRQAALLARLAPVQRRAVEERLDALSSITARICERDSRDRAAIEAQRAEILREMQGITRGRGAVAAYVTGTRPAGATGAATEDRSA